MSYFYFSVTGIDEEEVEKRAKDHVKRGRVVFKKYSEVTGYTGPEYSTQLSRRSLSTRRRKEVGEGIKYVIVMRRPKRS